MKSIVGNCRSALSVLTVVLLLPAVASAQGVTGYKPGQGGSPVKGAAGTEGSVGDSGLAKCAKPMGALAVVEPQGYVSQALASYGLGSPVGLIRLMVQQSNCFIVVERGMGMQNVMQERELAQSGQLRQGSNMGGGQMVAADFVLTPSVVFSESDAGGVGGLLGGVISRKSPLAGAIAGGLKFKEAQTSMLVTDARSGIQVAAAEGSTRKTDLRLGGLLLGGGGVGGLGGYGNTNEGKIIAAAFMDNYNKIVEVVRNDPSLQRDVGTLKQEAGAKTAAGAVFNEGDVVVPKIANVKLLAQPSDTAKAVATLAKEEELVVIGAEQNGYLNVQGSAAAGWVKKVLVTRR
ncbi:MAG: CsgG/HfaB family protein [Steroidobacteraceae bacterium]|nr:CsgG/HfaB family protein [Steroidobacteraceae bacterium]MDW8258577.1 CsgG/HfaB family protein [Gammaproteobacteria bacterium]